ncbi:MAG TPA: alpha/beta fold hydrolase, partial [Longimicrobiales bacterium]
EGAGDAVLFVHGFPFNHSVWDAQLAAVPKGWRFIAPDLRGFGQSDGGGAGTFSMDLFADDLAALLDYLAVEQAVICGLSMGGYVALSMTERHRRRVRALVLVASRANADSPEAQKKRHELAARARRDGPQPVVDSMLPKLLSAHTRMKYPQLIDRVRAMMQATPPETLALALKAMAARKDYTADLERIELSTMVVRGEQDEMIPAGDMSAIARTVRGARHEVISLAGHLPNLEASDVFNKLLDNFLNFLPPALSLGDINLSF